MLSKQLNACLAAGLLAAAAFAPFAASADPVALDGVIGSEWNGITAKHVLYDAAAPESNFDSPTNTNRNAGYDIYLRADSNYLYAALQTTTVPVNPTLVFSNLYFALVYNNFTSYASIGFETTNDLAFYPSTGASAPDSGANLIRTAVVSGGTGQPSVIEVAIDLSVFLDNALNVAGFSGLPSGQTANGILLTLSQSFGYSVAGGTDYGYGAERLGFAALPGAVANVPEPASLALVGLALAGVAAATRRRRG